MDLYLYYGLLVAALLLSYLTTQAIYNIFFHPLRRIPGPRLYAASNLPYIHTVVTGHLATGLHALHVRYGPVVRVAPNEVSFNTGEAWEALHVRKDATGYVFPKNYETWSETTNDFMRTIFLTGHQDHARLRKAFSGAFAERALRVHDETIVTHADRLIEALRPHSKGYTAGVSPVVDLNQRLSWLAVDTASDFVLGESLDCQRDTRFRAWLGRISSTWKFIAIASSVKKVTAFFHRVGGVLPTRLLQERVDVLMPVQRIVDAKLDSPVVLGRPSLLALASEQGKSLSRAEITANAKIFTIAGTDTIASTLPALVYLLLVNPLALKRLTREIRDIKREDDLTVVRVQQMGYLTACIQEALRIFPAVPEGLPRLVPAGGRDIHGYWIPEGIAVQVSTFAACMSSSNFDSPQVFAPERWIDASGRLVSCDRNNVFRPFSTGPRNCIGQSFAMSEMRIVIAKLIWNFDIESAVEGNWLDVKSYLLWKRKPLPVRLKLVTRPSTGPVVQEQASSALGVDR